MAINNTTRYSTDPSELLKDGKGLFYRETLSDLKSTDTSGLVGGEGFRITTTGRAGDLTWMAGDQSANVAADPQEGVWVAPDGEDGSNGAWVRTGYIDLPIQSQSLNATAPNLIPKSGSHYSGLGYSETEIGTDGSSPFLTLDGETDVGISDFEINGPGEGLGSEPYVYFVGDSNSSRTEITHGHFRDGLTGIDLSGGWNHWIASNYFVNLQVGMDSHVTSFEAGYAGSGYINANNYFGGCGIGVRDNAQWNATYINPIIENCVDPYVQDSQGSGSILINPWLEDNTNPVQWRRGSLVLGGKGYDFSDVSLFAGRPQDAMVLWGRSDGLQVFRDESNVHFHADGEGVKAFNPLLSEVGFAIEPSPNGNSVDFRFEPGAGLTSEETGDFAYTPMTSLRGKGHRFSSRLQEFSPASVEVQGLGSSSGSGLGQNRVAVFTSQYESSGSGFNDEGYRWYFESDGDFLPATDNAYDIGSGSFRPKEIFAANGTINTSDKRLKTDHMQGDLDAAIRAWASVRARAFKWLSAVEEKGDNARVHISPFAQEIISAFEKEGLNAFSYGLICEDVVFEEITETQEIPYQEVVRDDVPLEDGSKDFMTVKKTAEKTKTVETKRQVPVLDENGDQKTIYSIRATECLFLEMEYSRNRMDSIETRLTNAGF